MPETHKIPGYASRYMLRQLALTAIGFAFFYLIWTGAKAGGVKLWVGIGGFAGCAIAQFAWQEWQVRHFHCPKCGERLPVRRKPYISFVCKRCDIIWNTGLQHGRGYDPS